MHANGTPNGQPKTKSPPLVTLLIDPSQATGINPNGVVTLTALHPLDAMQLMAESIRITAMIQKKSGPAKAPKVSRAGLTMPDGSPAPIDAPEPEEKCKTTNDPLDARPPE